ncbi:Rpn family recombination-promoting nuclease/putative transposase [Arachidicoccus terrestris]|uniref:Rpn family recombination-promoting nuclease/putative transposase n=1 Tax=Arachidicoccus terrestris TaxID=2875539 RepID=UPI001CC65CD2|nr:Rpn family recombination-promoting nuclease/putative transposase [Arachidicoccus terrestris]UAY55326.1 Rpn family recombination-promoting nuclease/putative transposase [Arachidicoccus terrestris]
MMTSKPNEKESSDLVLDVDKFKYLNLMTDYGFKAFLGDANNIDLLIQFLNDLFEGEKTISHIQLMDKEILGTTTYYKNGILDILCEGQDNNEFIIEIQRVKQPFFKDRSVFFTSSRIYNTARKGLIEGNKSDYRQKPVYFIGLLDFEIEGSKPNDYKNVVQLCDIKDGAVFSDKVTYIYLELPKLSKGVFDKADKNMSSLEKWLFMIKNLHNLTTLPDFLQKAPFKKVLKIAEIRNMSDDQKREYELSLRKLWDENGIRQGGYNDGFDDGFEKGVDVTQRKFEQQINKAEKMQRLSIKNILETGGLSITQIAQAFSVDEAIILEVKNSIEK